MTTTEIPDPLPPAITISRETAIACMSDDLQDYGTSGPVALAWQWALTGKGPTPIALEKWEQGPPSHNMLLDESRWPHTDRWQGRAPWEELQHARFLLWWLTAADGEEVPARFRPYHIAPEPEAAEHGSVTITITEADRGPWADRATGVSFGKLTSGPGAFTDSTSACGPG
jgi:hypothetical protein